ncbi:MAG: EamA family transporter, partial [Alphaproteobacteria bacterium]
GVGDQLFGALITLLAALSYTLGGIYSRSRSDLSPVLCLFWLIRNAGAISASLMAQFMPVVAVALGAAVLGEALPWQAFAGLALILLGAISVGGNLRLFRRRPARA